MNPARHALLWASRSATLKERVPDLPFARRAVQRFMPGEELEDALSAAVELAEPGLSTIITHLGENLTDLSDADTVTDHYLRAIDRIAETDLDTEISIKLTQLGLDLDVDRAFDHLDTLAARAEAVGNWVWVDMEMSEYVDITLDLYRQARGRHANVGVCLQSYLYRTAADLESLLPLNPAIRLVKGAYMEPSHVAFPEKRDVDANFLALSERMLEHAGNGLRAGFATHDLPLIDAIVDRARSMSVPTDAFEIQMLYGIRTRAQSDLAAGETPVRVLISYGPDWYPWYMRRLAERPANVLFVIKNLA